MLNTSQFFPSDKTLLNTHLPAQPTGTSGEYVASFQPQIVRVRSEDQALYLCDSNDRKAPLVTNCGNFNVGMVVAKHIKKLKPAQYQLTYALPNVNKFNNVIKFLSSVDGLVHTTPPIPAGYYSDPDQLADEVVIALDSALPAVAVTFTKSVLTGASNHPSAVGFVASAGTFHFLESSFTLRGQNLLSLPVGPTPVELNTRITGANFMTYTRYVAILSSSITNASRAVGEFSSKRGLNCIEIIPISANANSAGELIQGEFKNNSIINSLQNGRLYDMDFFLQDEYGNNLSELFTPQDNLLITLTGER